MELLAIVFALKSHHSFVSSGLQFTILTYCAALNSIQEVDINTIESNRTFRALERILSHNVQVSYIPAHHNKVADFLSRTAVGEPSMPEVSKFITPTPPTATLNLIYDNKVLDLQLDEIAKAGSQEAGYHSLVNSVREGDNGSDIPSNSPLYEYTPFFEKLSLLDLPSGSLAIFNTSRITIPVCLRSKMLTLLHKHHFSEKAMLGAPGPRSSLLWFKSCSALYGAHIS